MSRCKEWLAELGQMPKYDPAIRGSYWKLPWSDEPHFTSLAWNKRVDLIYELACQNPKVQYWSEDASSKSYAEDKGGGLDAITSYMYCKLPETGGDSEAVRKQKMEAGNADDILWSWQDAWKAVEHKTNNPNPESDFLSEPIQWIKNELGNLAVNSMHWWLEVDDPFSPGDYGKGSANDSEAVYKTLFDNTLFIAGVIAVIALMTVGVRMALLRNSLPAADAARSLFTLVIVVVSGMTILKLLLMATDRFTRSFIVQGLNHPAGGVDAHCVAIKKELQEWPESFTNMNFFLFLLCAFCIIAGSVMLYLCMLGRVFVVTLLAGLLPLSAAGTATQSGRAWFGKQMSYLAAFIFVKPAAAIVLVTALRMSNLPKGGGTHEQQFAAAIVIFLGTVMLPAMVRLTFPFTAAAAQGDKGAKALVAGGVALGAKSVQTGLRLLRR